MKQQLTFVEFVTCERCKYGCNLGGNDYGCLNKTRRENNIVEPKLFRLVNKKDYSCRYAKERKE